MTTFKITFMIMTLFVIIGEIGFFLGNRRGKYSDTWNIISKISFYSAIIILVIGFIFAIYSL